MEFDVAIVGAGPAGSWLARELTKNNVSVILFERSSVAGEPNFSSAGSPLYVPERFNIPKEAVAAYWDIIKITGPQSEKEWQFQKPVGVVFDFRKLKKLLLQEAEKGGAKISLNTMVTGITNQGTKTIVKTNKGDYEAKIVIDASGPSGVIASQMGLRKQIPTIPAVGLEIIGRVPNAPDLQSRTLHFYISRVLTPHGYGWIFPMEGKEFKIGIAVYRLADYRINLEQTLDALIKKIPWAQELHISEKHGGALYGRGGISNHVLKNIIVIGDAADQVNPLGGEGIRHAFQSATFASQVIVDALHSRNLKALKKYNSLWKKYKRKKWFLSYLLSKTIYHHYSDTMHERVIKLFAKLTPEEVFEILFEYRFFILFRALFRRLNATSKAATIN